MITLAMAKGRTANQSMKLLERLGIRFPDFHEKSRKLVVLDESERIRLIFVKAVDVPTYVETGAADIGIVGKDILMEDLKDVYELVDLRLGICKLAVAGFPNTKWSESSQLIVASKYPAIAKRYFEQRGVRAEVIQLNGSIELAPLIGMADVIVDIVETGKTLRENGLVVLEEIASISARLIVNKASYAMKTVQLQQFIVDVRTGVDAG